MCAEFNIHWLQSGWKQCKFIRQNEPTFVLADGYTQRNWITLYWASVSISFIFSLFVPRLFWPSIRLLSSSLLGNDSSTFHPLHIFASNSFPISFISSFRPCSNIRIHFASRVPCMANKFAMLHILMTSPALQIYYISECLHWNCALKQWDNQIFSTHRRNNQKQEKSPNSNKSSFPMKKQNISK